MFVYFTCQSRKTWKNIYPTSEAWSLCESLSVAQSIWLCHPMNCSPLGSSVVAREEAGLPFPSPADLPNPGIEPGSPILQADSLPSEPPGKLLHILAPLLFLLNNFSELSERPHFGLKSSVFQIKQLLGCEDFSFFSWHLQQQIEYTAFACPQLNDLGLFHTVDYMPLLRLGAQSCLTLCNPTDCNPPGSSVHGDSPGQNTGVGCHALLQGIFPTEGSNPGLLHCRQILYHLSYQRSLALC